MNVCGVALLAVSLDWLVRQKKEQKLLKVLPTQ